MVNNVARAQYVCDPEKNVNCKKTNCHLNGGPCKHTANINYAKQPVEKVRLVVPMERTDAVELGLVSAEEAAAQEEQDGVRE